MCAAGNIVDFVLRITAIAAGVILVIVGFFLTQLSISGIPEDPTSAEFMFVRAHIVLTGVIAMYGVRPGERGSFYAVIAVWLGIINIWLGAEYFILRAWPLWWVLTLPATSLLSFIYVLLQERAQTRQKTAQASDSTAGSAHDIPADFGRLDSTAYTSGTFRSFFQIILFIPLLILLLAVIFIYGEALTAIIFYQSEIDFASIPANIAEGFIAERETITIYVVVYGTAVLIQGVFGWFAHRSAIDEAPDPNRDLSLTERRFIASAFEQLAIYINNKKNDWLSGVALIAFIAFFIAIAASVIAVVYLVEELASIVLLDSRAQNAEIVHYQGTAYFGGMSAGGLLGIVLSLAVLQYAGARWSRVGEYLYLKLFWNWGLVSADST